MSSTTNSTSHGMFLATAMAFSGTVILLAFRIQKSTHHYLVNSPPHPRSCLYLGENDKKKKKKKKKVHFAKNVMDPMGNSEEYRRKQRMIGRGDKEASSKLLTNNKGDGHGERRQELSGNKMALYNGILRDRVHHRVAYSC